MVLKAKHKCTFSLHTNSYVFDYNVERDTLHEHFHRMLHLGLYLSHLTYLWASDFNRQTNMVVLTLSEIIESLFKKYV